MALVWDVSTSVLQMLAPRFFGYIFAVVVMFAVVFYLMFMSGGKKRKSRGV